MLFDYLACLLVTLYGCCWFVSLLSGVVLVVCILWAGFVVDTLVLL